MELERVSPESLGVRSQAVLDMLDELYRYGIEMHGFMLLRHGKVAAEGYWKPYRPGVPHIMFSFSKSLTSTAIGFAEQEGLLSLDDRLIDIFPDKAPAEPSENLQACTVRHLLMMGCGHETEIQWIDGESDWITQFLHHPFVYRPGTHFLYNTAGTNLLSAILTRKTGQTLTEFLRPRLIEPLGLSDLRCHALPDGTEAGGYGYSLTLEDMARFMQFVANRGQWAGRQLLRAEWFDRAAAKQIENRGAGWGGDPDWQQGYGFQFWRCAPDGVFRGDGAFGQYGIVMPKQDAVLVIQSASLRLQAVLTAVWDKLLPGLCGAPLPEDPAAADRLAARLAGLELNPYPGMRNPGAEDSLNGTVYVPEQDTPGFTDLVGGIGKFVPDGGKLLSLSFRFAGDDARLLVEQDNGTLNIPLGICGHFVTAELWGVPYGMNACWRAKNQLELHIRSLRCAGGKRMLFRFEGDRLLLSADCTVPEVGGLSDPAFPGCAFRLQAGEISTKTRMYWEA